MGKRRKYTLEVVIFNKLAIERIKEAKLDIDDQGSQIVIKKKGMTGLQVIKNASMLVSNLISICCLPDKNGDPDNWSFLTRLMDSLSNIYEITDWEFTGTKFTEWIDEEIDANTDEGDNKTHTRVLFADKYTNNVNIMVGYDWED